MTKKKKKKKKREKSQNSPKKKKNKKTELKPPQNKQNQLIVLKPPKKQQWTGNTANSTITTMYWYYNYCKIQLWPTAQYKEYKVQWSMNKYTC